MSKRNGQWRHFLSLAILAIGIAAAAVRLEPRFRPEAPPARSLAQKSLWSACRDLLSFLVFRYEPPALSPEEKRVWKEWLSSESAAGFYPSRVGQELFWDIYSRLPFLVRDRLEKMPAGRTALNYYLSDLAGELGLPHLPRTFVENVVESFQDSLWQHRGKLTPAAWARAGLERRDRLLEARPEAARQWKAEHEALIEEFQADRFWTHAFEYALPYERFGREGVRVTIGKDVYTGVVRNGELLLRVPTSKMAHPAWNPISEKHLIDMIEAKVEPPAAWDVVLGHDGLFYLHDGNHRFAMYGKKEAWVRMSFPPKTGPLRNYLDLWGVSQPGRESILKLYRKQIGFWDMMPAHAKGRVILFPR